MLLGELLVQEGVLTRSQLENALRQKLQLGGRIGTNLLELGYVDVDTLARALARKLGVPPALAKHFGAVDSNVVALFSPRFAERYKAIPLGLTVNTPHRLVVAFVDPVPENIDEVAFGVGRRVEPGVAPEALVLASLEKFYGVKRDPRYGRIDLEAKPVAAPAPAAPAVAPVNPVGPAAAATSSAAAALAPPIAISTASAPAIMPHDGPPGGPSGRHGRQQPVMVEGELMPPSWLGAAAKKDEAVARPRMPTDAEIAAAAGDVAPESVGTEVALPGRTFGLPPPAPAAINLGELRTAPRAAPAPTAPAEATLVSAPIVNVGAAAPAPPPPTAAEAAAPAPSEPAVIEGGPIVGTPIVSAGGSMVPPASSAATYGVLTDDYDPSIPVLEPLESIPPAASAPRPSDRPALSAAAAGDLIAKAETKDQIGDALVDYLRSSFGAGVIFILKDEMALGWRGFAAGVDRDSVEAIALPMSGPSMLKIAFDGKSAFKGAPPESGANLHTRFWKMLKSKPPKEVVVVPIVLKKRVVNLVYAHGFGGGVVSAQAVADVAAVCESAAAGYTRLIRTGR